MNDWIPITEQLPPFEKPVLVAMNWDVYRNVQIRKYVSHSAEGHKFVPVQDGARYHVDSCFTITHWMQLPKAPDTNRTER